MTSMKGRSDMGDTANGSWGSRELGQHIERKLTRRGYITHGRSGWTVAFWNGEDEVRYLHGYADWDTALTVLMMFWRDPPDYQNGFCTIMRRYAEY